MEVQYHKHQKEGDADVAGEFTLCWIVRDRLPAKKGKNDRKQSAQ